MKHTHHAEQWLPYSVETVFDFFSNPENLPPLMPAWQKARIQNAVYVPAPPRPAKSTGQPSSGSPVVAGQGTRITLTFRPVPILPIRLSWDAEITEFVWDNHFCDDQLRRGPFTYWHHCHWLEARPRDGNPGTLVRDQVTYELPLGPLGDLANTIFVERQLGYIFGHRQKRTEEILAAR